MDLIRTRFLQCFFKERLTITHEDDLTVKAGELLGRLKEDVDGTLYWSDVSLEQPDLSGWATLEHMQRLINIIFALGYKRVNEDNAARESILRALKWWTNRDFIHPNWWWNEIGLPQRLIKIALPLNDYIIDDLREGTLRIFRRGSMSHNNRIATTWGGANLTWGIWGTIYYAMFVNDSDLMMRAVERFTQEIYIARGDREGIKPDYSFHQHGAMLQSGGYGRAYSEAVSDLVALLTGTKYQLPRDKIDLFCEFILEGQRYFTHKQGQDYLTVGREISRKGIPLSNLRNVVGKLLTVDEVTRKQELQDFYDSLKNNENTLESTRYFPNSYTLTHHRKNFYMSAKGSNTKIMGTECANFENYLAHNHFYGSCTCYMADGDEYFEINPLWDHCFYPGTTAYLETDEELLTHTNAYKSWYRIAGTNDHCGGLSQGNKGALYQLLSHDGLSVLMTFIAFDLGMIVMGAGLEAPSDNEKTVVSTIDQCYLKTNSYMGLPLEENMVITGKEPVVNGGFSYYNLCDKPLHVFAGSVTGNWGRNNRSYGDEVKEGKLFRLWYDHGSKINDESFAYAVLGSEGDLPVAKLINTKEIQGAEFTDGSYVLVFHEPGRYMTLTGVEISSGTGVVIG